MSVYEQDAATGRGIIVDSERYKYRALAGAIIGFAFDGIDFLVLALAMPLLLKDWGITMVQGGVIATATLLGACFAGYIWGPIADKWGRKKSLMACLCFFGCMTAVGGFAQNYVQLAVIRFIAGLGLGGEWALGGTLVAEYFPPEQRSKATGYMQWGWPIGYSIALGFNAWLVPIYGWRALFFAGISSILGALFIWFFVPESPAWLRSQENKKSGAQSHSQSVAHAAGIGDLFRGANIKVTILAILLCASLLTAYWAAGSWIPTFLAKERGLNIRAMTGFIMGINLMNFIGCPFFGWFADKFGRRWSLGLGSFGSAIGLVIWVNMPDATSFFWVGMAFNFICQGYWGPVAAFVSEQFPTNLRAFAVSFAYSSGRLVAVIFPMVLGAIAMKSTLAFAMGLLAIIYAMGGIVTFMMKETRGTVVVD